MSAPEISAACGVWSPAHVMCTGEVALPGGRCECPCHGGTPSSGWGGRLTNQVLLEPSSAPMGEAP